MEQTPEFLFSKHCVFEPVVPNIETMRVLTVNDLIHEETDFSDVARGAPDFDAERWVKLERHIAGLALANIESNVRMLVRRPEIRRVHFTELSDELIRDFDPDALILSGTLRDFDYYDPELLEDFNRFIRRCRVPVLAICGGHQLVGQAYGARVVTLDNKLPGERRSGRQIEYQYRFVRITDPADPIFAGIDGRAPAKWQQYTSRRHLLRVWQNHGLQVDRLPEGFRQLARGYLSEVQMMVRRTAEQLIYGVQFHIEKSFQDWQLDNYWEHRNESRDGRLIFENFLHEALRFRESSGPRTSRMSEGSDHQVLSDNGEAEPQRGGNLTGF
ncbi:MAG TPA: gamma-glutamyl-gamma-aminobutyrate hydrolase family protein [Blastocatellia bacterium]|nr:gamma-glutamyl-gamma-aminobutyrate hydrolase family protein [Blastocatellia bacterium]